MERVNQVEEELVRESGLGGDFMVQERDGGGTERESTNRDGDEYKDGRDMVLARGCEIPPEI